MASPLWMKSQRISFIIVWNIMGELHSLENMMVGSNSPVSSECSLPLIPFLDLHIVESPLEIEYGEELSIVEVG